MLVFGYMGLVIGCGGLGLWLANRVRKRPKELRECSTMLSLLDTEIFWGATPLPEAFKTLKERIEGPWQGFLAELQERLQSGETASNAWRTVIKRQTHNFCLKAEDWEIISDVGKGLGNSDRQEQHKHLELIQKQLESVKTQAGAWSEKQAKMWSYLGFLIGIAAVIAII